MKDRLPTPPQRDAASPYGKQGAEQAPPCSASQEAVAFVLSHIREGIGEITLQRPQALNALNLPMMRRLLELVDQWEKTPEVSCFLIRGAGPRAFCAGGDLRSVYHAHKANDFDFLDLLFRTEYTFNRRLHALTKPYLALLHGIVMGGGVGASLHGSHRVVTDSTVFAMPETGIGFFPDVGGTYFLNRCPPEIGLYVGLTGARLSGSDALYAGFATHYIGEEDFCALVEKLPTRPVDSPEALTALLADFAKRPPPSSLQENHALLKRCFLHISLEKIGDALARESSPFAQKTLETLQSRSPLSLRVTFQQLTTGQGLSLDQAMKREFAMSQNFLRNSDFLEGIRAAVIDKDRCPRWRHTSIDEISQEDVDAYFRLPPGLQPL